VHPEPDSITTFARSLIQFGGLNQRVYLMKLDSRDVPGIANDLERLARAHDLTKVCAKVPSPLRSDFLSQGFVQEACVPGLFNGTVDGLFLARFLQEVRGCPDQGCPVPSPLQTGPSCLARSRAGTAVVQVRKMGQDRVRDMAELFRDQFSVYPFPVHDPDFLAEFLESHGRFFGVEIQGRIAALASSEMNSASGHVEMTDFIVLPAFRGQGLATALLRFMEAEMRCLGLKTAFSIARTGSAGMNAVFARQGYGYRGRLVQNTCFNGRLEDMNIWSRRL